VIPLGSRLYIEGIGELIAEDTGRRIKGKILDIFLPSVKECIQFGKRQRDVDLIVD
jgi:3D (Asp-Asp-Asp) domain-containing protein